VSADGGVVIICALLAEMAAEYFEIAAVRHRVKLNLPRPEVRAA
jgi:hypothetical protein